MNREIKFRAWHTEQKRMFEVYGLGIDFVTENTFDGVDPGYNAFANDDLNFIEIMQYTGLKDINGKYIYEGDIVRWGLGLTGSYDAEFRHRYATVWIDPDIQFKIIYYVHSVTLERVPTDDYLFNYGNFAYQETELYLEVIGNIYENPELL